MNTDLSEFTKDLKLLKPAQKVIEMVRKRLPEFQDEDEEADRHANGDFGPAPPSNFLPSGNEVST